MKKIGGLILAAGMSSRMGEYKPLMKINGISMIRRIVNLMKEAGAEDIVVVTGYRKDDVVTHLADENVIFVHNEDFATTQQLDSLKLGLLQLHGRCNRVMISPVDVPLVKIETVKELLVLEGDFIRPLYQGEPGHPVILDAKWIDYIVNYNGQGGLKGAMESSDCVLISHEVKDEGVILDNDTKEDFGRLLRYSEHEQTEHA